MRRYRLAGFTLHPAMLLWGTVPRAALPVVDRVREGSLGDVDLMESVDRQIRGAAHGVDHEAMAGHAPARRGRPVDRVGLRLRRGRAAAPTCWRPPTGAPPPTCSGRRWRPPAPTRRSSVDHVTAANEWAVDVGMACRMELWTRGYLGLRGLKPPAPYLHSGHFL